MYLSSVFVVLDSNIIVLTSSQSTLFAALCSVAFIAISCGLLYGILGWCAAVLFVNSRQCRSRLILSAVVCWRNIIHNSISSRVVFLLVMETP